MRQRSRSSRRDGTWRVIRDTRRIPDNPNLQPTETTSVGPANAGFIDKTETIQDEVNLHLVGSKRRLERQFEAARRLFKGVQLTSAIAEVKSGLFQVHRCHHTKSELLYERYSKVVAHRNTSFDTRIYTHHYHGGAFLSRILGLSHNEDHLARWNSIGKSYTAEPFRIPDWFSLVEQWKEAQESVCPSASLLGESIVENAIFIEAFKAILNPTRLLHFAVKEIQKVLRPGTTLGKVRKLANSSSNLFLGFNFGVKPALDEIANIFTAHRLVNARMRYLAMNVGNYVPVRVRNHLPSVRTNANAPSGDTGQGIYCLDKSVYGCISSWAKVREDLNLGETWKAYLQYFGIHKFLGLAWELVPFSFVVDWVTNVGEYVNRLSPSIVNPFYNIRGICSSTKEQLEEEYLISPSFRFTEISAYLQEGKPLQVARLLQTTYDRTPSLPTTSGFVDFSNLGLFHGLASGAMIIQRTIR